MLLVVENAEVFDPVPRGRQTIVIGGSRFERIGAIDVGAVEKSGVLIERVDAGGCVAVPGLIDPHVHFIGGSGEEGFASQSPEITAGELFRAGITTAVGTLGVDTTTRNLPALLGKAKGLKQEGLSAYIWTGGYDVPPKTLTGSVRDDMLLIEEVIGAGETAIADLRSTEPTPLELARLATECYVGGILSSKAGVLHLHVGDGPRRLRRIWQALEEFDVEISWFYPTHAERNEELMKEAIRFAQMGGTIDLDVFEEDLAKWLRMYVEAGADLARITISTDSAINAPRTLLGQIRDVVDQKIVSLDVALALATSNTASILKLRDKGHLKEDYSADLLLLERDSLQIRHVFARGRQVVRDGQLVKGEKFREKSKR